MRPPNPGAGAEFYSRADIERLLHAIVLPYEGMDSEHPFLRGYFTAVRMIAAAVDCGVPLAVSGAHVAHMARLYNSAAPSPPRLTTRRWQLADD